MTTIKVTVPKEWIREIDLLRIPFGFDSVEAMAKDMIGDEIRQYREALEDDTERLRAEVDEKGRELKRSQATLAKLKAL